MIYTHWQAAMISSNGKIVSRTGWQDSIVVHDLNDFSIVTTTYTKHYDTLPGIEPEDADDIGYDFKFVRIMLTYDDGSDEAKPSDRFKAKVIYDGPADFLNPGDAEKKMVAEKYNLDRAAMLNLPENLPKYMMIKSLPETTTFPVIARSDEGIHGSFSGKPGKIVNFTLPDTYGDDRHKATRIYVQRDLRRIIGGLDKYGYTLKKAETSAVEEDDTEKTVDDIVAAAEAIGEALEEFDP